MPMGRIDLYDWHFLSFVTEADCTLVALMWDMAQLQPQTPFYLQSETGRLYNR